MKNHESTNIIFAVKKYIILFLIFFMGLNHVFGEIKNGYEKDILSMRECLKNLNALVGENNDIETSKRRKIESKIEWLVSHISYYQLTENLLNQFRVIAPTLYNEIDRVKDSRGRTVDVYVKFIPTDATDIKAWGTTYMSQDENDKDAYRSEYGNLSVSVKIWIVSNALLVLSHEFGHVKYQVAHLADYFKYYKKTYFSIMNDSHYIGHDTNDPSGKSANQYEKLFRKEYVQFLKSTNESIQNPVALVEGIKKTLRRDVVNF